MGVAEPLRNRPKRRRVFAIERLESRTVLSGLNGFPGIANTGVAPPDPDAAAGPASLLAVVDGVRRPHHPALPGGDDLMGHADRHRPRQA